MNLSGNTLLPHPKENIQTSTWPTFSIRYDLLIGATILARGRRLVLHLEADVRDRFVGCRGTILQVNQRAVYGRMYGWPIHFVTIRICDNAIIYIARRELIRRLSQLLFADGLRYFTRHSVDYLQRDLRVYRRYRGHTARHIRATSDGQRASRVG